MLIILSVTVKLQNNIKVLIYNYHNFWLITETKIIKYQ